MNSMRNFLCAAGVALLGAMSTARAQRGEEIKPTVIRYGASVREVERALAGSCSTMKTRRIDPPFLILRDTTHEQMQIDCDGFSFLGRPRWAEFIFADNALAMAWIVTTDAEADSIRARLVAAFGEATDKNATFVAFATNGVALRTDRAEVLFFSDRLRSRVAPWFGPNSTFR